MVQGQIGVYPQIEDYDDYRLSSTMKKSRKLMAKERGRGDGLEISETLRRRSSGHHRHDKHK
jgi:hypothetical protein